MKNSVSVSINISIFLEACCLVPQICDIYGYSAVVMTVSHTPQWYLSMADDKLDTWQSLQMCHTWLSIPGVLPLIARFMGPTWGPSGAHRTQVGPMLAKNFGSGCWSDLMLYYGSIQHGIEYSITMPNGKVCARLWIIKWQHKLPSLLTNAGLLLILRNVCSYHKGTQLHMANIAVDECLSGRTHLFHL